MGLRTASVRHPHVEVMAPAQTETNQTQTFKLPPDNQSASPINSTSKSSSGGVGGGVGGTGESLYIAREAATCKSLLLPNGKDLNNVFDTFAIEPTELLLNGGGGGQASDNNTGSTLGYLTNDCGSLTMSSGDCPIQSMGDQERIMGIQKVSLDDVSEILKRDADVDQILNHLPVGEADTIMQVLKAIDNGSGVDVDVDDVVDQGGQEDQIFASDLNLTESALEEDDCGDLFGGVVDVMNMSIDDQLMENTTCMKEAQTKERLTEVGSKQAKLERKLDFLMRRIRKYQVHCMGQHVSGEVAGVFEHVHRTLKLCKELPKAATTPAASLADEAAPLSIAGLFDTITTTATATPSSMASATTTTMPMAAAAVDPLKPMTYSSTKNLMKKLELSNALLASNAFRQKQAKYFGAGSAEATTTFRPPPGQILTMPEWTAQEKQELKNVSGYLESELRLVQEEVDSEATASSSGGESCDESEIYNNPHQQFLPIHKRAAWKYAIDRSAIASKWTWLQSQIADLEYKIRQHNDLHKKIRHSKESVKLGGQSPPPLASVPSSPNCLNGYRGQLPGASPSSMRNGEAGKTATTSTEYQCARTRPLVNFRKRKLLQVTGLHAVSKKAARPSSTRCGCIPPNVTCALCTGRTDPTYPRDHSEYMSRDETLGLLDPSYHPVFSLNEDASAALHMEAIMKTPEWQQRSSRTNVKSLSKFAKGERGDKSSSLTTNAERERPRAKNNEHRKKYNRLIKPSTANALSAKIKNRYRGRKPARHSSFGRMKKRSRMSSAQSLGSDGADDEVEALGISGGKYDSPNLSPLLTHNISGYQKRNRADSYDIDNIIIPYSVAASTRVEKLPYKEILTPKWRIAEGDVPNATKPHEVKNNGVVKTSQDKENEKELNDVSEDLTDILVLLRHEKCEVDERKKFLTYLKLPIGYGRSRANRRTDSRAESSGANTPDPMSPAPVIHHNNTAHEPPQHNSDTKETNHSPLISPPATPMPLEEQPPLTTVPSISALRRRTVSQTRPPRDTRDDTRCNTPELEVPPYEKRLFPISDDLYDKMVRSMPDDHKLTTNRLSQDSAPNSPPPASTANNQFQGKEHDSESTESAFGDEDPNDPEWDGDNSKDRSYNRTR